MKLKRPAPIYLRGGDRAILLLHSFTGTANEMKKLATHLHNEGFTCYAPIYKGHGSTPTDFYASSVDDWLASAKEGYTFLQREGFSTIAIVGQSLGGVFALRLATILQPKAIVTISSPVVERALASLEARVKAYTDYYLRLSEMPMPEQFIATYFPRPVHKLRALQRCIVETAEIVPTVTTPALVLAGKLDAAIYQQSAQQIYDTLRSDTKMYKVYDNARHLLTVEKEPTAIFEDITQFLIDIM